LRASLKEAVMPDSVTERPAAACVRLRSGGRVLGVTASGATLSAAIHNTYEQVQKIHFDGMHYRKDIGQKGLKRW